MQQARALVVLFVVLLLAGAVINLSIAIWATRAMVAPPAALSMVGPIPTTTSWPGPTPVPWPAPTMSVEYRAFAYKQVDARSVTNEESTHAMQANEFGWPLPTLAKYQYWWPWDDPQWGPDSASETGILFVWRGVFVNPLVFAIPAWLVLAAPFVVRSLVRRSRLRRGLCGRCGYPLRGGGGCSECGAAAPASPAAATSL